MLYQLNRVALDSAFTLPYVCLSANLASVSLI